MDQNQPSRPLLWAASSKRDLLDMPQKIKSEFGHGLHQAQIGAHPSIGKVLNGFGGANVIELVMDDHGDTFRAVYTVIPNVIQKSVYGSSQSLGIQRS